MKMTFYLCGLPPQNAEPQFDHKKNMRHIPTERHFTKYLNSASKKCQGHQTQGKPEKLS